MIEPQSILHAASFHGQSIADVDLLSERCDITWKDMDFSIDVPVIDSKTKTKTSIISQK